LLSSEGNEPENPAAPRPAIRFAGRQARESASAERNKALEGEEPHECARLKDAGEAGEGASRQGRANGEGGTKRRLEPPWPRGTGTQRREALGPGPEEWTPPEGWR
jgi:hypothetical protein